MIKHVCSKLKAAFIGPCIGVGGGDALMASLVRHSQNIEWVGAAALCELTPSMASWASLGWDTDRCPLHVCGVNNNRVKGVYNHPSYNEAVYRACKDAQIIISWCTTGLDGYTNLMQIPVIEYAQNSDEYAKKVVAGNKNYTHYKAACSEAAATVFGETDDVTIIYNGIDPARVAPRKGRTYQRKVWAVPDACKIVLFMGRFVDEKNPLSLVKAISELPDEYIAVFVGHGYNGSELYKTAKEMIPNRCAFVDPVYHVGDILAAADCYVLPSDFEGHPLALMEAMLAGTPTVYTDLPVMKELHAKHGEMGVMIPNGSPLAPAIKEAIEGDPIRRIVGRTTVWEEYTIGRIASRWEEYIHACLNDWWARRYMTEIKPVLPRKPLKSAEERN
jgi:glycosyltransferase involved in cell wall biosynthesis